MIQRTVYEIGIQCRELQIIQPALPVDGMTCRSSVPETANGARKFRSERWSGSRAAFQGVMTSRASSNSASINFLRHSGA